LAIRLALAGLLLAFGALGQTTGEPASIAKERIKAAFLYKFAGYVEWPASAFGDAASPLVIGVAGSRAVAEGLEQAVAGKRLGERGLRVRRLASGERRCDGCHVLFIGPDVDRERAAELLGAAQGKPLLTVTDGEGEHPAGSIIHFVVAENRVRFDISREDESRQGLRLASPLLSVARNVKGNAP
jgi:hypothetical protein